MGKYTGSMCRLCRAEGKKLFLKGRRCLSDRCAVEKKNYPPGMKGSRINFRKSHYKNQLREKQKVKRFYGVGEKQFRNVFAESAQKKGITGENLLRSLEMRLDNVVYRLNFAYSRNHARQMIRHGFFAVNGKKVNIPSYIVALNDVIRSAKRSAPPRTSRPCSRTSRAWWKSPAGSSWTAPISAARSTPCPRATTFP